MALKLFCSACQKFIKEISPKEATEVPDNTVCKDCKKLHQALLDRLNADYRKRSAELAKVHNEGVEKLENTIRKAFEG